MGHGKTGSSAIQSFLNYNRDILYEDFQILYPDFVEKSFRSGKMHNHCLLFKKNSGEKLIEIFSRLENFCLNNSIKTVIISCEWLLNLLKPFYENSSFVCWLNKNSTFKIHIIYYVRRQDHWIEASWKQWGISDIQYSNIYEYKDNCKYIIWDHFKNIQKIETYFPDKKIIIRPYEKESLPRGILPDFLSIIDIDYDQREWNRVEDNKLNINTGFNRDVIEILNLNKDFYRNRDDNRLSNFLYSYLDKRYLKNDYESYNIFTNKERINILKQYEQSNKKVAIKYLKRNDGILFNEPYPAVEFIDNFYSGLTIEKMVPIFTSLIFNIEKKMSLQQKKIINSQNNYFILTSFLWGLSSRLIQITNKNFCDYFYELADIEISDQSSESNIYIKTIGDNPSLSLQLPEKHKNSNLLLKISFECSDSTKNKLSYDQANDTGVITKKEQDIFVKKGKNDSIYLIEKNWNNIMLDLGMNNLIYSIYQIEIKSIKENK